MNQSSPLLRPSPGPRHRAAALLLAALVLAVLHSVPAPAFAAWPPGGVQVCQTCQGTLPVVVPDGTGGGPVSLRIYDLGGREVRTLATGHQGAGGHTVEWDGRDDGGAALASGTYFARLVAGGLAVSRTLVRAR